MNVMYLVMGYIFVPSKIHAETRLSLWQLYEKEPLLGAQASGSALVRGSVFSLHWQVHYKAVNLLLALLLRVPPLFPFLALLTMWGLHHIMTQQEGPRQKGHLGLILSFCECGKEISICAKLCNHRCFVTLAKTDEDMLVTWFSFWHPAYQRDCGKIQNWKGSFLKQSL